MTTDAALSAARALLRWYVDSGVDEAVAAAPTSLFAQAEPAPPRHAVAPVKRGEAPPIAPIAPAAGMPVDEAAALAAKIAGEALTIEALKAAVEGFEHCPLKAGARTTVFADGVYDAPLLVIGEAPGREEDLVGKPFVGRAGQLLDRMLAAIGMARTRDVLISNVVYWRPPGNRTPTQAELAVCRPFVLRLIDLTRPKAVMLAGGAPTQALAGAAGIMRARGVWRNLDLPSGGSVPALPMFHPAFLLRQPAQKRLAWRDLQSLAGRLRGD
jgi:DNA polymerase